jgi:PBSX family phage portal protein
MKDLTKGKGFQIVGEKDGVQALITTRGQIVTQDILKQYEISPPESKQISGKEWRAPIVEPPYDLAKLMAWMNVNVIHSSCVRVKVQDTVGIGFHLEEAENYSGEEEEDTKPDDEVEGTEQEQDIDYKKLMSFFAKVNDKESLTMMLKKVVLDYEGCGQGYIEVARDANDEISALYHVNAITVRWCNDKKRLIQRVGEKFVYFKIFGDEEILNKKTGNFVKTLGNMDDAANEIIPMNVYSWMSSCYGLPDWLPALYPMFGDMKEQEYNIDFFMNYGVPAYAILLEGVTMNAEISEEITKYFDTTLKGSNHKTLTLSTPKNGSIKFERLSVEQKEASFRVYKKDNRMDILAAHRVPPYRVGVVEQGQLGGNVADETDKIYLESVINPRQEEFMWIINTLIINQGFDIKRWILEFDDINIANQKTDSEIYSAYIDKGVMTPNEVRVKLGLEPYDGGDTFYVSGMLIPSGTSPDVVPIEGEGEEKLITCSNCQEEFDFNSQKQVKSGIVKCPACGWFVNPDGKAVEKEEEAKEVKIEEKGCGKKPKVISNKEAREARKVYKARRK